MRASVDSRDSAGDTETTRTTTADVVAACQTDSVSAHLKLSGELSGEYVVLEVLEDGRIVLRADTSAAATRQRAGLQQVSDEEFEHTFGHLPTDGEG